jgi:hypothetical protein
VPAHAEPRTILLNPDTLASTGDPDHIGYVYDQYDLPYPVTWTPVKAPCRQCGTLIDSYNKTMQSLMNTRYWIQEISSRQDRIDHEGRRNRPYANGDEPQDPDAEKISAARLAYELGVDDMAARLPALQAQEESLKAVGDDLRSELNDCEIAVCQEPGAEQVIVVKGVDTPSILPFNWQGPYNENCEVCANHAKHLNELPAQARNTTASLESAKAELMFAEMELLAIDAESNQILFTTVEGDTRTLADKEKEQADYQRHTDRHRRDMEREQTKAQDEIEKYEDALDMITKDFGDTLTQNNQCSLACMPPPAQTGMNDPQPGEDESERDAFLYDLVMQPF